MGSILDTVAAEYHQGRPSYPDELYETVEELSGTRFRGAVVLDIGAIPGISTRRMLARGATVMAIDLGSQMISRLRAHSPDVKTVHGDGAESSALLPGGEPDEAFVTHLVVARKVR
jgi:2-polyprenyl-3-methyl-5-hydroxy-6-metoxy-1,4-benzoquinol methylase